jgi:uncharacterized membrane protein YkoI
MKRILIVSTLAMAMALGAAVAAQAATSPATYAGHELAGQAKIGLEEAQAVALRARPGAVTDKELEKETGGSGLRWSFDIKSGGKTFEVGVDAKTGKILENKAEGPHPD